MNAAVVPGSRADALTGVPGSVGARAGSDPGLGLRAWRWSRLSLSARIVTVFLILLIAIQTASFLAISLRMQYYIQSKLPGRLAAAEQVLRHQLAQRSAKLLEDARLLAADYGFRVAVLSNDAPTIASALTNHGARIRAVEAVMLRPDFSILAVSDGGDGADVAGGQAADLAAVVQRLSERAVGAGSATETAVMNGLPHEWVLVPMKAPMLVGWVLMGFALPDVLARDVKMLSSLDMTLLARPAAGQAWAVVQSTLPPGTEALFAARYRAHEQRRMEQSAARSADDVARGVGAVAEGRTEFRVGDDVMGVRPLRMTPEDAGPGGGEVVALLSLSVTQAGKPPQEVQFALILATGMGMVLFGVGSVIVARRVTTPLRALSSAAERLGGGDYVTPIGGGERNDEIGDLAQSFEQMRISVATKQQQIIQSEKLASIGQLSAGVAHEINNPMGFVSSNFASLEDYLARLFKLLDLYQAEERALAGTPAAQRLKRARDEIEYDYLREDIPALMTESRDGIDRVLKIVQDLKDFSHTDTRREWEFADLHAGLDSTLNIVSNEIRYRADVVKEYGELPAVECVPSELNQVFMNLLVNAAHAMGPERGTITVRSGATDSTAWVSVSDTGSGIPADVQKRIFDPFFTTKPVGKGTGLGLSLSYGIVKKHGGRIEVKSEPGQGTTFRVSLPLRRDAAPSAA